MLQGVRERQRAKRDRHFMNVLERYHQQRSDFLARGKVSVPSAEGTHSVLVSTRPDWGSKYSPDEQMQIFIEEGEMVQERLQRTGQYGEVVLRRAINDIELGMAIRDPEVSDLTLIGHGSISDIWVNPDHTYDWQDVARASRHLKLGTVTQRTCGNAYKRRVPWATFLMKDMRNYYAALGRRVPEKDPDDDLFMPVFTEETVSVEGVVRLMQAHIQPAAPEE